MIVAARFLALGLLLASALLGMALLPLAARAEEPATSQPAPAPPGDTELPADTDLPADADVPAEAGLPSEAADHDDDDAAQAAFFRERVQPFLVTYCQDCHAGETAPADIDFERYGELAAVIDDRDVWRNVAEKLDTRLMPPEDMEQPPDDERAEIVAWILDQVTALDCSGPLDAGRVTIRRLSRYEYRRTIRDLVGIDYEPSSEFPSDDVGYGFDNIGDVLSLPPLLFEKYLDAAEAIARAAIVADNPAAPRIVRVGGDDGSVRGHGRPYEGGRMLASNGQVRARFDLEFAGQYVLRIGAWGQQAGDEPARMALRWNGTKLESFDVAAVAPEPGVYEVRVEAEPGSHRLAADFLNDYYRPDDPDPEQRDRNLFVAYFEIEGPFGAEPPPPPETHRRIIFRAPASDGAADSTAAAAERDEVARDVVERFASRAYRRPATGEEIERLVSLVHLAAQEGESFERGIQLAVTAVLVSPQFLFRLEDDAAGGDLDASGAHPISPYELATRLSYFLWSTMPDEELLAVAASGRLVDREVREGQVRRMLADPRAAALVENFALQWLQLRNLERVAPDQQKFPTFDDSLRADMLRETELFVGAIMAEDRSVLTLLDADFTFVNERLARHYGLEGVEGEEFRRLELTDRQRGGVLTQASVLTVTSNPTRTSPVKRGKWILEQLLGTPPPPPPAGVEELSEAEEVVLSGSLRQRMEQHRTNPNCAVCHAPMDPLGFGLENYDAVGAWREMDGSFAIDASGALPSGESFAGPSQLKDLLLSRSDAFRLALTEKMLTYALGRGLMYDDRCTVEEIARGLEADDDRFSRLVIEIAHSRPFLMRRAEGDRP